MNRRFAALTLTGALSLSLLSGCVGPQESGPAQTPTPAPTPTVSTAPVEPPAQTPDAAPSELPADPGESAAPSPEPAGPSESPEATEVVKPVETPTASPAPSPTPSETPAPSPSESIQPEASKVQSIWAELSGQERPELMDLDDALLSDLYGIESGDVVEYVGKMPFMNVNVTEFLIARCAPGKADAVKAACERRLEDLKAGGLYPSSLELVDNYKLVVNGDYVLFAIDEHADEMVKTFNDYTK